MAGHSAAQRRYQRLLIATLLLAPMLAGVDVHAALTTLINNGLPSNRVDVVFVGDGYTQAQLNAGLYTQHVMSYANYMLSSGNSLNDPLGRYAKFFNVHAIDVASQQSGADRPFDGVFVNTALDATFENTSDTRLLTISTSKANALRNSALAGTGITANMQLAVVNESKYGGSGGTWATYAGLNSSAREIALHELGHSFSGLADEYFSPGVYTGGEPSEPNVTKNSTGAKWAHWAGFDDPRGSDLDIGSFEGGRYFATGIYRPSNDSKMRSLNEPFNAVSREAFILDIYDLVHPLDGWLSNSAAVNDDPLWIDLVDGAVQAVQWYVDGTLVPSATGEMFDAAEFGVVPGNHTVRARAYDRVLDHVGDGGMLDLVRKDLTHLEQSVTWTFSLTAPLPGDFDGDRRVDGADLSTLTANFGLSPSAKLADGDADKDGDVDGSDFLVWQQNVTDGPNGGGLRAVPEPATCTAALLAAGCVAIHKRRRRSISP